MNPKLPLIPIIDSFNKVVIPSYNSVCRTPKVINCRSTDSENQLILDLNEKPKTLDPQIKLLEKRLSSQKVENFKLSKEIQESRKQLIELRKENSGAGFKLVHQKYRLYRAKRKIRRLYHSNEGWFELKFSRIMAKKHAKKRQQFNHEFIKQFTDKDLIEEILMEDVGCPICMEPMIETRIVVNCGHAFCKCCLVKWCHECNWQLLTCPICRGAMDELDQVGTCERIDKIIEFFMSKSDRITPEQWEFSKSKYSEESARLVQYRSDHSSSPALNTRLTSRHAALVRETVANLRLQAESIRRRLSELAESTGTPFRPTDI